jgi:hypothetical protein
MESWERRKMIKQETPELVVEAEVVLASSMQARESFSAHDITKKLRDLGIYVDHQEVRQIVHTYMHLQADEWNYTKVLVPNQNGNYWIYQPALVLEMHEVDSSWIESVGYDPRARTLVIATREGYEIRHKHVDSDTAWQFLNADSKGAFYNTHIKGQI